MPPKRRVIDVSAWVKGWKIASRRAGVMPIPVSRTANVNITRPSPSVASVPSASVTVPSLVNLTALPSRFTSTCRRRSASTTTVPGRSAGTSHRSVRPFWAARCSNDSTVVLASIASDVGTGSIFIRPASIFEKSRMSSMMTSSDSADARIVCSWSRCGDGSGASSASSAMPRMPFIGVRISWLMFARKSLLARLASSAHSFASVSCAVRCAILPSRCSWWRCSSRSRAWIWASMSLNVPTSTPSSSTRGSSSMRRL